MPKHTRGSSSSHNRYSNPNPVPVSLAPSMPITYSTRPTLPLNTNLNTSFYSAVPSSTSAQQVAMQQVYEPYPSAVPAQQQQQPPIPHRPSSGAWTPQDDQNLLAARQQGHNWAQIQSTFFPSKSPNACRKRHERLLERRGADDWDARKLERLAKEYISMRKEIWQGLAQRTGEKWNVVEHKCMSHGLKNLQSAARSANRRERLEQGDAGHRYENEHDDSGYSGMGLTPVDDLDPSYPSPAASSSHSGGSHSSYMHHQQQHQHHHHPAAMTAIPYGGNYSSNYNSSVSPNATHGGYGASMHHQQHHSQDSSPYMGNGQRLPSVDMGIEAIINRPGHGQNGHGHGAYE